MTFKHVTLAMDLSLSQPGFAVLAITDDSSPIIADRGKPILLEKSFVKTNVKKPHGYRLGEISDEIRRYMKEYDPSHIVREKGFSRFPTVTQTLFKVVGVSDLVVSEDYTHKTVHEIATTSVKKLVTGNGKSTKEEVAIATFKRLQIENTDDFYYVNTKGERILIDDMTDAAAVGLAYYKQKGLIG